MGGEEPSITVVKPALEERYVEDGTVKVDELKDDHFERVVVFV